MRSLSFVPASFRLGMNSVDTESSAKWGRENLFGEEGELS